jgi:valyl-tRNA synthetase
VQEIVTVIRQFRSRHGISPVVRFEATVQIPDRAASAVAALAERIQRLAGVAPLTIVDQGADRVPGWTGLTLNEGSVNLPPGLFDAGAERARLQKQRDDVGAQLARTDAKLGNQGFTSKAAAEIVEQEREKQVRLAQQLAEIDGHLAELAG